MTDYEKLEYNEETSSDEEEELMVPAYKQVLHTESVKEKKKENLDNLNYVRRFLRDNNAKETSKVLTIFRNKIINLNSTVLKQIVENKKPTFFSLEQYRYYRFLEFLLFECKNE